MHAVQVFAWPPDKGAAAGSPSNNKGSPSNNKLNQKREFYNRVQQQTGHKAPAAKPGDKRSRAA